MMHVLKQTKVIPQEGPNKELGRWWAEVRRVHKLKVKMKENPDDETIKTKWKKANISST